jgi:hypothetical protein
MIVQGIKAKHAIVSPTCQANKGILGAGVEASDSLMQEKLELADLPFNKESKFHFVLSVERPDYLD